MVPLIPDEDKTFSGSLVFGFANLMTSHAHTLLKAIVSLYCAKEEKSRERYKTRFKVAEENKLFWSLHKNISEFLGVNKQAQKFVLG